MFFSVFVLFVLFYVFCVLCSIYLFYLSLCFLPVFYSVITWCSLSERICFSFSTFAAFLVYWFHCDGVYCSMLAALFFSLILLSWAFFVFYLFWSLVLVFSESCW